MLRKLKSKEEEEVKKKLILCFDLVQGSEERKKERKNIGGLVNLTCSDKLRQKASLETILYS